MPVHTCRDVLSKKCNVGTSKNCLKRNNYTETQWQKEKSCSKQDRTDVCSHSGNIAGSAQQCYSIAGGLSACMQ